MSQIPLLMAIRLDYALAVKMMLARDFWSAVKTISARDFGSAVKMMFAGPMPLILSAVTISLALTSNILFHFKYFKYVYPAQQKYYRAVHCLYQTRLSFKLPD